MFMPLKSSKVIERIVCSITLMSSMRDCWMLPVAYLGGIGWWPPKDFLAPKCRLKRRLIESSRFRKITKFVATRCQILRQKCTKFNLAGALPQTPLGELTALPDPLAGFKGAYSKGREGKGWEWEGKREEEGRKGEGKGRRRGEEKGHLSRWRPPNQNPKYATGCCYHFISNIPVTSDISTVRDMMMSIASTAASVTY